MNDVEKDYRGAIALNNIGVLLLEKGSFRAALETLQDAVVLMKKSCRGTTTTAGNKLPFPSSVASSTLPVEDMLLSANKRLVLSSCDTPSTFEASPVFSFALSDDSNLEDMEAALRICPLEEQIMIPVRIDTFEGNSFDEKETTVLCTCVLHNFGISCLCRAKTVEGHAAQLRLVLNAIKIFHLCQAVLSTKSASCPPHQQQQLTRLIFLGYVVVSSMVIALRASGKDTSIYQRKLTLLKTGVRELGRTGLLANKRHLAPAA